MGKKNGDAPTVEEGQLAIAEFKGKEIRKVLHDDEWYFSVVDVVEALADTSSPRRYWSDLKVKLANEEGFDQLYDRIVQLKMVSSDGKHYATDAADTETIIPHHSVHSLEESRDIQTMASAGRVRTGLGVSEP